MSQYIKNNIGKSIETVAGRNEEMAKVLKDLVFAKLSEYKKEDPDFSRIGTLLDMGQNYTWTFSGLRLNDKLEAFAIVFIIRCNFETGEVALESHSTH